MRISFKISYSYFQNILLWLLITAGAIKPFFIYVDFPFDWTLMIFSLVVFDIAFNLITRKNNTFLSAGKLLVVLIVTAFYALLLLSLTYTPSNGFSIEKSYLFAINLLFFIYPLFIRKLNLELHYKLFLYFFIPLAVWFILFKALYFSSINGGYKIVDVRFYEIRKNYLGFGTGLCVLVMLQIYLKKSFWVGILSVILLLGLGARGALVFLVITLAIWKWKSIPDKLKAMKIKTHTLLTLLTASLVLPILVIAQYQRIYGFLYLGAIRFQSLFLVSSDKSIRGRFERLAFASENIFSSIVTFFFGNGIGSFGIMYLGQDVREYPHNIFVEVQFELGVLALLLFCLFLFVPFLFKRKTLLKVFVLFFLLNAMKSGDLSGLWLLFFFIGLLVFNPKMVNEISA